MGKAGSRVGAGCLSLFLAAFLVAGLGFFLFLARDIAADLEPFGWSRASCAIVESAAGVVAQAHPESAPYEFRVRYRYNFAGRDWESMTYSRRSSRAYDFEDLDALEKRYRPGSSSSCWVNASDPRQAVLARSFPWQTPILIVPAIFILIGGGGLYGMFFYREPADGRLRATGRGTAGYLFAVGFCALFALAGFGLAVAVAKGSVWKWLQSRTWQDSTCTVVASRVREHDGEDGTSYSPDILYSYFADGVAYRSNRYSFAVTGTGRYRAARAIVDRHPPGAQVPCSYNPAAPGQATLRRGFPSNSWIILLLAGFGCAGLFGFFASLRSYRDARIAVAPKPFIEYRSDQSALLKFLGILVFAVIWNGILAFLLNVFWKDMGILVVLFGVIFGSIGLLALAGVVNTFRSLFQPCVRLRLGDVRIGSPAPLDWQIDRDADRFRSLSIVLAGSEQGTDKDDSERTITEVFRRVELLKESAPVTPRGRVFVALPRATMHSFTASSNRVVWTLELRCTMNRGPGIQADYTVVVRPEGS